MDNLELINEMILAARQFYGAAVAAQEGLDNRRANRIARLASKSYADEYLMAKFGVDSFEAHHITNLITHRNLSWIEDDPENYSSCEFYAEYVKVKAEMEEIYQKNRQTIIDGNCPTCRGAVYYYDHPGAMGDGTAIYICSDCGARWNQGQEVIYRVLA